MKSRSLGLVFFGILAGLLLSELSLQLLKQFSPKVAHLLGETETVDRFLEGSRVVPVGNPNHPEHDEYGYRNAQIPTNIDVLAMGDSQTYGTSVLRHEAWPSKFESLTQLRTYNAGIPGWAPLHSLGELEPLLKMSPKLFLQTIYPGNDLLDTYLLAIHNKLPETQSRNIASLEAEGSLKKKGVKLFQASLNANSTSSTAPSTNLTSKLALIKLARGLKRSLYRPKSHKNTLTTVLEFKQQGPYREAFKAGSISTIFTSQYRAANLDISDARLRLGARLIYKSLKQLQAICRAKGVRFVAVLIPTKETAYWPVAQKALNLPELYRTQVKREAIFRKELVTFTKKHEIPFIDTTPKLQAKLLSGNAIYPAGIDGHLNILGNYLLAQAIQENLNLN